MSPRIFKLGLALFLVMSGLFGAKLSMLGTKGPRSSWFTGETAATAPAPTTSQPAVSPLPPRDTTAKAPAPASARDVASSEAESAAHGAPLLSESDKALVAAIRLELKSRGYNVGHAGTVLDLQTRAAILAFEADNDLRLTGEASQPLLHRLLLGATSGEAHGGSLPAPRAEEVIRDVQASLKRAGHPDLPVDGRMSTQTVDAIRAFERSHGMKVTGRVSGDLVARLQHVARDGTATP